MTIPFDLLMLVIAAATVTGAYVIFGISAFGAALFTVPVLSHFLLLLIGVSLLARALAGG